MWQGFFQTFHKPFMHFAAFKMFGIFCFLFSSGTSMFLCLATQICHKATHVSFHRLQWTSSSLWMRRACWPASQENEGHCCSITHSSAEKPVARVIKQRFEARGPGQSCWWYKRVDSRDSWGGKVKSQSKTSGICAWCLPEDCGTGGVECARWENSLQGGIHQRTLSGFTASERRNNSRSPAEVVITELCWMFCTFGRGQCAEWAETDSDEGHHFLRGQFTGEHDCPWCRAACLGAETPSWWSFSINNCRNQHSLFPAPVLSRQETWNSCSRRAGVRIGTDGTLHEGKHLLSAFRKISLTSGRSCWKKVRAIPVSPNVAGTWAKLKIFIEFSSIQSPLSFCFARCFQSVVDWIV